MRSRLIPCLPLLLILLLHSGLVLLNHPGAPSSDDKVYFEEAKNILNGSWESNDSPKNHRFGVILPAVLSITIFGETGLGIYFWPLLCSLLTLILLYEYVLRKYGLWNACLATGILALNLNQIVYSGTLFPDVVSSFFLFATGLFLLESSSKWKFGIIAGIFFFLSIWVRETAFLFLPALILPALLFPGEDKSRKGLKIFLLVSTVGIILWQLFFWMLSGDPSFVYSTVETHHNAVFANPEKINLFSRLLIDPFQMILHSYSLLPLLLLCLPALLTHRPHSLWFLVSVAALWLGTTSLSSYSPLPLLERFWIVLLPLLSILSIYSLNMIPSEKIRKVAGGILFLGFLLLALYFTWCNAPFFTAK